MEHVSYYQLLTPLILTTFAVGFALLCRAEDRRGHTRPFAIGYLAGAACFTVLFFAPDITAHSPVTVTGKALFLCYVAFMTVGMHHRAGLETPSTLICGVIGAAISMVVYFGAHGDAHYNVFVMNGASAILLGLSLPVLRRYPTGHLNALLTILFAIGTAQFVLRPAGLHLLAGPENLGVAYSSGHYALVLHFTVVVLSITVAGTVAVDAGMSLLDRLRDEAIKDPLTGCLNRRGLSLRAAERKPPCSVVVCDIDHFKRINDMFGHAAGDELLTAVAEALRASTRATDHVARTGGEEFVIVLERTSRAEGLVCAERARKAVQAVAIEAIAPLHVTASFGIVEAHDDETIEHAIARADAALYEAKEAGRNRVVQGAMRDVA